MQAKAPGHTVAIVEIPCSAQSPGCVGAAAALPVKPGARFLDRPLGVISGVS